MTPRPAIVRPPAAAGAFYPAGAERLAALVDRLLAEAAALAPGDGASSPVAIVVPHAGYVYSGAVAATAFGRLRTGGRRPRRVVLAGPAHFVPIDRIVAPAVDAWSTPLGPVAIDDDLRTMAVAAGAIVDDRPHTPEHSLEVELPFLQRMSGDDLSILPLAVGEVGPGPVADVLTRLLDEADVIVVSTDLSHYHPDAVARRIDRGTIDAIVTRRAAAIELEGACGVHALRGVVELARLAGRSIGLLDYRTSADAGGDTGRVVGYASLAVG